MSNGFEGTKASRGMSEQIKESCEEEPWRRNITWPLWRGWNSTKSWREPRRGLDLEGWGHWADGERPKKIACEGLYAGDLQKGYGKGFCTYVLYSMIWYCFNWMNVQYSVMCRRESTCTYEARIKLKVLLNRPLGGWARDENLWFRRNIKGPRPQEDDL